MLAEKTRRRSLLAVTFLKVSNNGYGEVLTKAMGRKTQGRGLGRRPAGDRPVCAKPGHRGRRLPSGRRFRAVAHEPNHGAAADDAAAGGQKQPWFAAWYNALPIAGQPGLLVGGTLQSRMVKTAAAGRAHAKSGSMTGVSSLSGYVDSATGRPLAFAIISNNYLVPGAEVKALEDRLVETLAACDATVVCR